MAMVVTYWRLPEEESSFLDHLEKSGEVLAVVQQNSPRREAFIPRPVREVIKENPQAILLFLEEHRDLLKVVPFQRDGATWYGVHAMKSPVIDYLRGKWINRRQLGQSNISSYANYPDEKGARLIAHPESYVKWAKQAASWIRRSTPYFYQYKNYRITTAVNDRLEKGLELVS
jgi:hypothetical protein